MLNYKSVGKFDLVKNPKEVLIRKSVWGGLMDELIRKWATKRKN